MRFLFPFLTAVLLSPVLPFTVLADDRNKPLNVDFLKRDKSPQPEEALKVEAPINKVIGTHKAVESPVKSVEVPAKTAETAVQEKPISKIEELKLEQAKQNAHVPSQKTITPGIDKSTPKKVATVPFEADGRIMLVFDRAKIMPVPKGIASIIIGNPLIADVALQPNGIAVLTGKGNGTTNMIALDSKGNTIFEKLLTVKPVREQMVTVYRADNRETLTCNPHCNKTPTVGDSSEAFDAALNQANNRNSILNSSGRAAP